jgi:hypothetical protein
MAHYRHEFALVDGERYTLERMDFDIAHHIGFAHVGDRYYW